MDYEKAYNNLIERAKNRIHEGYVEKHHIIPRCLGGSNNKSNIVRLTAREHYVAHLLLVKIYPGNHKLVFAAAYMCSASKNHEGRSGNRLYEWLKIQRSKLMSDLHSGKTVSEETRQKLREKNKNYRPTDDAKRRSREAQIGHPVSEETKKKISEANKGGKSRTGQKNTPEHTEKIRIANTGRIRSEETRKRLSESHKGLKYPPRGPMSSEQKEHLRQVNLGKEVKEEIKEKIRLSHLEAEKIKCSCILCKFEITPKWLDRHQSGKNCNPKEH